MYSSRWCPYCMFAKRLLKKKGVDFEELLVDGKPERWDEIRARTNRETVPQIFIGDTHVGGYDELSGLDRQGKLDALLFPN